MNSAHRQRRLRSVTARDGGRCLACGATDDLTLDHVEPKARGGVNAITNLQTLCRRCNQRKADTHTDYRVRVNWYDPLWFECEVVT